MGQIDTTSYLANLAFLLNYGDGTTNDEVESEIFKSALQSKETIHYDRAMGGGFPDLEQDPANIAAGLLFSSGLIESVYRVNAEKNFDPYIVVGFNDVIVTDETSLKSGEYLVEVQYRLLKDLEVTGSVSM